MKYTFHPEVEAEFLDAIGYYEDCEPGLGYDFAIEVHSTIKSILSFQKAWTILEDDIRRCQTRRFPYGIVYSQDRDVIFILAVMHLHRDPDYWKDRV
ncbi:MAG: type II toxin-antitoxin system RelE/ParE family toxin [Deltaproteobacteria bacterium]|nr:type II toxin-antitoxin system RelE/ParE family toxin [Deltaproteobacteria bacterium]